MKIRHSAWVFVPPAIILTILVTAACSDKTAVTVISSAQPEMPAVPNDSIVTAKIINIQTGDGAIPWVLTVNLLTSQDVPGMSNVTAAQIGQQLIVRTMDDISGLKIGQIINAHLRFEGDEKSSFYYIWDMHPATQ
jgi:hypothetical protein